MPKVCTDCGIEKDIDEFHLQSRRKDGHAVWCKICMSIYSKDHYQNNKERLNARHRDYYQKNKEEFKVRSKRDYQKNKENVLARTRKYYQDHKEEHHVLTRRWRQTHKDEILVQGRVYRNNRYKTDTHYRLMCNLRCRINDALMGKSKSQSTKKLLGCSIEYLKTYLESKFQDGMTWKNKSYFGWHIDHIIPCSAFDLADAEQQRQCFHYSNLQPLWRRDNMEKNAKILLEEI